VVQQLMAVYRVKISISNSEIRDCTITVTFENEDIEVILSIIAETFNLQLVKENEAYIFSGDGCINP